MARWDPDSRDRLQQAALELYAEHGFDRTTVAEIAQRAGLTERTFFRHFADKREVLFDRSHELQDLLVASVTGAPAAVTPIEAVARALEAAGARLQGRREHSRRRQQVIDSTPTLQERELIKLAALAAAIAEALRGRGVTDPAAGLTAEAGIAVFKVAYVSWIEGGEEHQLPDVIRVSFDTLRTVTAQAG